MCVGFEKRHEKCQHLKLFIIKTRCDIALQTANLCDLSECSISGCESVLPLLCIKCYQEAERDIRDKAEEDMIPITRDIIDAELAIKEEAMSRLKRCLEKMRDNAVSARNRHEEKRDLAIAELRESQEDWHWIDSQEVQD